MKKTKSKKVLVSVTSKENYCEDYVLVLATKVGNKYQISKFEAIYANRKLNIQEGDCLVLASRFLTSKGFSLIVKK